MPKSASSLSGRPMIPDFLTHYFRDRPFQSLTELGPETMDRVLMGLGKTRELPRRLRSSFYFEQRRQIERTMFEQFIAKGGEPERRQPHYAILGESVIWAGIEPHSIRVPLDRIPTHWVSFTYTDSWAAYVDQDLRGNPIPRKPAYGTVYRLEELGEVVHNFGWPGDRWKTDSEWQHDVYVEAQIWSDVPLRSFVTDHVANQSAAG
jgi:hypothetical protein